MWVSRKHYDDLRSERVKCHEEARVLAQQNAVLQGIVDSLCQRLTISEHERILLLKNYMGLTLPEPQFAAAPIAISSAPGKTPAEVPLDVPAMLGTQSMFSDMGDDAARKLGVNWDDLGNVKK